MDIVFSRGELTGDEQAAVSQGFAEHSELVSAPNYVKERIKWIVEGPHRNLLGALTADVLWDWLYVDEL